MTKIETILVGFYAGFGWAVICFASVALGIHFAMLLSFFREWRRNEAVRAWTAKTLKTYRSIVIHGVFPEDQQD
jgi:hypothetical protein